MMDDYLSAGVEWVRLLLTRLGSGPTGAPIVSDAASVDAAIEDAQKRMAGAAEAQPRPPFVALCERFELQPFERNLLLFAVAMELDTRIAGLCARAQDDPARPYPTFGLAFALFNEQFWAALSPERPLRLWHLVEISMTVGQPLVASPIRADERIVNAAKGLHHLDERLDPYLFPLDLPHDHTPLPASTQETVSSVVDVIKQSSEGALPLLHLVGGDAETRQLVALRTAEALGLQIARLPADLLPPNSNDVETVARLWNRDSFLLPLALYVDGTGTDDAPNPSLKRFLLRTRGVTFVDVRDASTANVRTFEVQKPSAAEQQALWQGGLGNEPPETAARMAAQFDLSMPRIERIAAEATAFGPEQRGARAWATAQQQARARLDALAQRVDPRATWDDLVLPEHDLQLLHRIAEQVAQRATVYDDWGFRAKMNRGLGIAALFAGESGTGKTMAAEVLANALRVNLYRIDLASVINKYIGETEKNIRRLFDAADDGGAILFFDEAEALFGKRVQSRDSHDRNANIEIAYLLQRMETYRGLAILATNKRSELDSAFLRRIRFIVSFPFPGAAERREIWRKSLPPRVPAAELDMERLARLNLTGGSVHNVVVNASFAAASLGSPVTMPLLFDAARAELKKLQKPINEAELTWSAPS